MSIDTSKNSLSRWLISAVLIILSSGHLPLASIAAKESFEKTKTAATTPRSVKTASSGKSLPLSKFKSRVQNASHKHVLADEAERDSFAAFRKQLIEAVRKRDRAFVDAAISPDILTALGGGKGKESFYEIWQNLDKDSPFWARIERILLHGAQLDSESGEYHSPAVSFDDSHSELPQAIVWTKQAALRKAPNESAALVANLYDEQITLTDPSEASPVTARWAKVRTNKGLTGFMNSEDFYSAYDEFATFKKTNGNWYLTWFGFAGL